jgi:hypothetical protein
MKNLATALVKAQKAFSPALKNSTNPHFKSRYADLATCVEAVMDALNDNGIALIQKCYECPSGIMVETVFMHESGEIYESGILQFPASKQDPQGYMSALTYARRGSLMAACGIAPEDDDGNAASRKPAQPKATPIITPNGGARENVSAEELLDLEELAYETTELCKVNPKEAYKLVASKCLDEPQHRAFWTYLDSKTKSALKAAK